MRIHELNSPHELPGLAPVWHALLEQTPGATYFQSLDWLRTYGQFYGHQQRLRVLILEDGNLPVGILPLTVCTETNTVGKVRVLTYPLHGWGSFYGPIGPNPAATLWHGLQHVQRTPHDWDLFDLRWVDTTGSDHGRTPLALLAAGLDFDARVWHVSAQVELTAGWETYWATRKSHWRSNVRRCQRLLESRGELRFERFRPRGAAHGEANPRWDLYDTCVEIARRSWQGNSTTGTTLSHVAVRDYFRAAHATAVQAGAADINLLYLANRPIAFSYNYAWRGWVYGLRIGFDATANAEGGGTVLMAKMLEDSAARGDTLVDLGPDYLDCKRHWLTRVQPAYHYTHFRRQGLKAQVLRIKRAVGNVLRRRGKVPVYSSLSE